MTAEINAEATETETAEVVIVLTALVFEARLNSPPDVEPIPFIRRFDGKASVLQSGYSDAFGRQYLGHQNAQVLAVSFGQARMLSRIFRRRRFRTPQPVHFRSKGFKLLTQFLDPGLRGRSIFLCGSEDRVKHQ